MAIDFQSDPAGRFKGWTQRPNDPRMRLTPGWEPRPEYGAGQGEDPNDPSTWPLIGDTSLPPLDPSAVAHGQHTAHVTVRPSPSAPAEHENADFDWGAISKSVFPEGVPATAPPPDPGLQAHLGGTPKPPPDPDLQAHLGGTQVAGTPAPVYPSAQTRTLSSSAPTPAPQPPVSTSTAAPTSARATSTSDSGGAGSISTRSPDQQGFVSDLLPTAQAVSAKTGIPWQVLIAIPANETGWGSAVFHNNYFGIKGPGASSRTWEVIGGKRVDITDSFRTYDSAQASMEGFAQFLHDNPRYSQALAELQKNPNAWPDFVHAIHAAGYATDPHWADQVIGIGQSLEGSSNLAHTSQSSVAAQRGQGGVIDTARSALPASSGSQVSQFGDTQLSAAEAYAACGPAAAVRFASRYGRNPTLREATDMAKTVGWTESGGMAGIESERNLLSKLDIPTRVVPGAQWSAFAKEAQTGNPITISTPGHYYYVDGYNPQTDEYHVGRSGLDLKGGKEWMTPAQMEGLMGKVQGALFADNPAVATDSGTAPSGRVQVKPNAFTDDASYVAWTYRNGAGRNVPSSIPALYATSRPISVKDAVPGDMVVSGMNSQNPDDRHVGIFAGNGQILTAKDGVVTQTTVPEDGEYRRLSGTNASDLSRPVPQAGPPAAVTNPIVRYTDNGNGTWNATHADGSVTLEFSVTQPAPVEGGRHPSFVRPRGGAGQEPLPAVVASAFGAGAESAEPTMSKKEASYTKRAADDHCGDCSMFRSNKCTLVKGYIHTGGSCDYYEPKKGVGAGAEEGGDGYDPNDIDPLTGLPRGRPAREVIPEAIAAAPGAVGEFFNQLGTFTHAMLPTEEQRQGGPPEPPPARTSLLPPMQEAQPTTPPEDLTATSPVTAPLKVPTPAPPEPTFGPTLAPDNPIMQQAHGEEPNPMDVNTAVGRAVAQSVVPEPVRQASVDLPVVGKVTGEDVAAQVLSPGSLIGGASAGAEALERAVATEAPIVAPRIAAQVAAAVASNLGQTPLDTGEMMVAGKVAGKLAGPALKAVPAIVHNAVPFVKALAESPVGKFLTEDQGSINNNVAFKVGRNVLAGTQIGGIIGITPDLTNPQAQDPDWWSKVRDDYAAGAKTGGIVGLGVTGAKYGMDKTITPTIARWFSAVFNPRMLIPDATAQVAAATRANVVNYANWFADALRFEGNQLFGKAGTGLNTAEAAAFAEQNRTLQGFVSKDGVRVTPEQEAWLQRRLAYEDDAQARLDAAGVIGPTQNVVAGPPGTPGPSVHITHLYDPDVTAAQQVANRGVNSLGWRDATIVHGRAKTIDPAIDPNTPRTITESLAEYARDPKNNKKPLDDMVTRFEVSAYQTEKALANRAFYDAIRPPGKAGPGASVAFHAVAPADWVRPEAKWGFGQGVNDYRFEPNLANYLNNISGVSQSAPWLQWYGRNVAAPLKSILFTGSTAHLFNTAYRVASTSSLDQQAELFRSYIMPTLFKGGYGNLLLANKDLAMDAAMHGLTAPRAAAEGINPQYGWAAGLAREAVAGVGGYGAGYTQAKARGESEEEAQRQGFLGAAIGLVPGAPGVGALIKVAGKDVDISAASSFADIVHHAIFREGIPAAKLGMYDILTRAGVDPDIAASRINNTLGGIDQVKMGRSPWVQDLMRYGLVAGDWTEGEMRTLGNTFMPNQMGASTRMSLVKGLAGYMATMELFNQLFNGHPTWQNGDGNEYKLEVTGLLNGLAGVTGNNGIRSVDPKNGTPMRSFVDPMPPLRWMMETLGEGARQAAYTQGQLETKLGAPEAGQRLMTAAGGDLSQGNLPPNVLGKVGEDVSARLGPGPSLIGALSESLRGQQHDWTGKPLDPPDFTTIPGWEAYLGHTAAGFAPAMATSALQNIDLAHSDWRSEPVDALIEMLGFTRVNRSTELNQKLSAADRVEQDFLHVSPDISKELENAHQSALDSNDKERADAYAALTAPDSQITHAQHDDKLHQISNERRNLTRRQEIANDYASRVPEGPIRDTVQKLLENVWNVSGSPLPADLNPTTDVSELAKGYWSPQGVDPTDQKALRQARTNLLNDFAASHNEDPEALQDLIKWQAQHQDDLSKATPPIKTLPGVSSGQLGQITSDYLQSGEDAHGQLIQDVNQRGDKMRAFLKDQAKQIGVTPEDLLERINLRLSPVDAGLASPIEKSYTSALNTFFNSRDADNFPRYVDANGKAIGTRADWDTWDKQIADVGAGMASKLPKWRELFQAQERGNNAREKALISSPNNTDYERFFGFGRSMTEPEWKDYTTGKLVGYTDLKRNADKGPPASETIRRDKIQELYRASNQQERIHTRVRIWLNGSEREVPLIAAYTIARKFMVNTSGRSLESMAAHDEMNPSQPPAEASTVGADDGTQ